MLQTVMHGEGGKITLLVNGFPSASLAHAMHIDATNPYCALMQRPIFTLAVPALGGSVHCTLIPPRPVHTRACCPMHVAGWRHESVEIRIANPTHQGRTFAEWTRAIGEFSHCRRGLLKRFSQSSSANGNLALVGSNRIKARRGYSVIVRVSSAHMPIRPAIEGGRWTSIRRTGSDT